jgi:DNA polymerase-1
MCTPPQEAELWKAINRLLRGDNEIIFHNAAFDAVFLFRKYGIQIPKLQDTMVAQAILWPDLPKSLGFTTSLYTEMPYYKEEGKEGLLKGGGTYKEADHQFWIYNAKDAVVLPEIFKGQEEHLHKQSNWRTYTRQRDCIQPIIYMASVGINVNKAAIVEKEASVQKELSALQSQIDTLAKEDGWTGETLNANSPKQLKEYFFAVCGQPITKRRGKVTTDEKALKTITRRGIKGSKTAALIQDFRALKKFSGTYLNMLFDEDGRLRSSINPVGTETGRFSSSQTIFGTGGNMQNMPYSFRVFLEPDPGYVGFEVDLSQAENRIVALLANEDKMLKAFELGMDIHSLTAALIMGKEYEEISDEKGTHPIIPQRSERYLGKQANHASNYDMGANTASLLWGTTIPQTEKIIRGYHKAYPGIRMWHRSVVNHARETGQTITNLMGRSRTYLGRWDKNLHHQMYAFLAQSLVADHINEYGILEMWRERYNEYRGLQLLMQIHDSLLFQANLSLGWPVIATKIRTLCDSLRFPITKGAKGIEIPTNITIYPNNFSEGFEWKDKHPGPTAMKQMYEKMRKTDAKS